MKVMIPIRVPERLNPVEKTSKDVKSQTKKFFTKLMVNITLDNVMKLLGQQKLANSDIFIRSKAHTTIFMRHSTSLHVMLGVGSQVSNVIVECPSGCEFQRQRSKKCWCKEAENVRKSFKTSLQNRESSATRKKQR